MLRLLGRFLDALERHAVLGEVELVLLLKLGAEVRDDRLIEVLAAEVRVAIGRTYFEDRLFELQDRDVERTAPEVVDRDRARPLLVDAVRQGRGGRLVDDALDLEASDAAGVAGGLALAVVEVGRDRDDGG